MAIYSFNAKVISRSAGQSSISTAAYNAREKLTDERTGEIKDFTRAEGLIFSGIYTPKNAPEWAQDRAELWNRAEAAEKRQDATIARNYRIALPHELTDEQRRFAIQDFIKENFTRKGYAADLNIHAPDKDGDNRNYHAHILVTDRRLEPDGFAPTKPERQGTKKERAEKLEIERESWEKIGNRHLERHGFEPTLDRRTLEAQGIDREATIHKGVDVSAMERKGKETDRGNEARQIEAKNSELENLKIEAAKVSREIEAEEQKQEREKTEATDPTLYNRGGMVSQQKDAMRDHQERQKILDAQQEKKAEPDQQREKANQNEPQNREQREEAADRAKYNEGHESRQRQNEGRKKQDEDDRTESAKKSADYATKYGKIFNGKEPTEAQRERYERAANKAAQRERGDREQERGGETTDRVRERTRER